MILRDENLAEPYAILGRIYLARGQFDQAILYGKRAVGLNSNGADWHMYLADTLSLAGNAEEALVSMNKALRLNPVTIEYTQLLLGRIYYQTAQYETAIGVFQNLIARPIGSTRTFGTLYRFLIASYAASGQLEAAHTAVAEYARERTDRGIQRGFLLSKIWVERLNINQTDENRLLDDLRKAGLPE